MRVGKKKIEDKQVISELVKVKVRILPAFRIEIESDSTGHAWSGHTWYGPTAKSALLNMRNSLKKGDRNVFTTGYGYKNDELKVGTSTPEVVAATGWKEPTFD